MNNNVVGHRADVRRGQPLHREQRRHVALGADRQRQSRPLDNNTMSGQARAWPRVSRRMWAATAGTAAARWAACTGNQDARHIYSKLPNGTTIGVNHTPPVIAAPTADFPGWYENAIPGPSQPCTTIVGTPPSFDGNYPSRDNSVGVSTSHRRARTSAASAPAPRRRSPVRSTRHRPRSASPRPPGFRPADSGSGSTTS